MAAPIPHRAALRDRIIPGNGRLPPIKVDDLRIARAAANDDRTSLVAGFLIIGLTIATFVVLGVAAFLIGRGL